MKSHFIGRVHRGLAWIFYANMAPSSMLGLGHHPFKVESRVRLPVGSPMQFLNCDEER